MAAHTLRNLDSAALQLASHLRRKQAESLRGNTEGLSDLDATSDLELLRLWTWRSAILGVIAAFVAMPLLTAILDTFVPSVVGLLFWSVTIASMAAACAMFGFAAYLTFAKQDLG